MIKVVGTLLLLTACAFAGVPNPNLALEDVPSLNVIRIINRSDRPTKLFYGYSKSFGPLQMFMVRFRDSSGVILPVAGRPDGWFTPKLYEASLTRLPSRSIALPATGSVEFERSLAHIASWAMWRGAPVVGPCEVQIKLFAYLDRDERHPVEAMTEWKPGPCPS